MYRKRKYLEDAQVIMNAKEKIEVLSKCHDDLGHFGIKSTYAEIIKKYWKNIGGLDCFKTWWTTSRGGKLVR